MFHRYEAHIQKMVKEYPMSITFNPAPYALTTVCCRFRDAVNSLLQYGWKTEIDVEYLRTFWHTMDVVPDGAYVLVRLSAGKGRSTITPQLPVENEQYLCEVDNPQPVVVHALAILFQAKTFTKPAKLTNVSDELLADIQKRNPDVSITRDGNEVIML